MNRNDPPDEVFERPGIKMIRRGRFLEVSSHRSPEEQKELNRRMRESRPAILATIEIKTKEFIELVHKYSSLDLVGNLFLRDALQNPNEYIESESPLRLHWIEHAAILELKDSSYEIRAPFVVNGADLARARQLLEDIFMQTTWYYISESSDPSREGPPSAIEQLRFMTLIHGMSVRSPAYSLHWRDVLIGLFGGGAHAEHLLSKHSLDIESALKIIDAIENYINTAMSERVAKARNTYHDIFERLKSYKETGKFNGSEEDKELFDRIRNMRAKEAKSYLKHALTQWTRIALARVLSFTEDQLSEIANVRLEKAQAVLNELSIEFGSTPQNYLLPAPVNNLHERPIIHHKYGKFCPAPHLLPWALKPTFERVLMKTPYWQAYQKQRGTYLIRTTLKYLADLLPGATTHESLYYPLPTGEETELDGIVLFDRYAFLIEAKAGSLGAARRGGPQKIKSQLDGLVGDAVNQVVRARNYIHQSDRPIFKLKTGETIIFDRQRYTETVLMTVTLDALDIFTAEMYQMRDIGVVTTHDLPWSVALTNLRCISEIIARPFEFTHYLRWRLSMIEDQSVSAGKDELNWLAVYLKEGPKRLAPPSEFEQLTLTSYTDDFDAYFLYKEGLRRHPAPRPAQDLPSPLNLICDSLISVSCYGFTQAGEYLLDLNFTDRKNFARALTEFAFKEKRGKAQEMLIKTEALMLNVVPHKLSREQLSKIAEQVYQSTGKRTFVLNLTSVPNWQVLGWAQKEA